LRPTRVYLLLNVNNNSIHYCYRYFNNNNGFVSL